MKRKGRGISSIYGFIVIFLLCMASIQTWSSAVGTLTELESLSEQSHELEQMQELEHLSLSLLQGDLRITNVGQIPSTLEYLRIVGQNDSRTIPLNEELAVGASLETPAEGGSSVEVVTSLGNVFVLSLESPDTGEAAYWSGELGMPAGNADAQIFENPFTSSSSSFLYLGWGAEVYAFTDGGTELWSFDAGQGYVTDVLPLPGGDVYVSVGYAYASNTAELFELGPTGAVLDSIVVRLDQSADGPLALEAPVSKGLGSQFALYDGWFYGPNGPVAFVPPDDFPLAASAASSFYFYQTFGVGLSGTTCGGEDEVKLFYYNTNQSTSLPNWADYFYLGACDPYPPQLLAATASKGIFAGLFSENAYVEAGPVEYRGQDPYLVVVATDGSVLCDAYLAASGYSSIATNGTSLYLALPQLDEVQVLTDSGGGTATYHVGFPASQLIWAFGSLFAVSPDEVRVYDGRMDLQRTISLTPLSLSSFSNGFLSETTLHNPSFIPLNSTSYAALLENYTGYVTMVIGRYT